MGGKRKQEPNRLILADCILTTVKSTKKACALEEKPGEERGARNARPSLKKEIIRTWDGREDLQTELLQKKTVVQGKCRKVNDLKGLFVEGDPKPVPFNG